MDISSQRQVNWHIEVLPRQTKKAFDFLSQQAWLKKSNWYLAGGTALALQTGSRKSLDLDFFTEDKSFDENRLLTRFFGNKHWKTTIQEEGTIYGELFGAKISFIAYPFFIPKRKSVWHGSIRILDPRDIAVMKIIAISQRGRKRDFIDMYWCAKNLEPLEEIIKKLKKQYPTVAHDFNHILKSLVYFDDADTDPMPEMYFKISWNEVKDFFMKEIPRITRILIELK